MLQRHSAGDRERTHPREVGWQIVKTLAEKDAGLERVRLVGGNCGRARATNPPKQASRDHHLMHGVRVQKVFKTNGSRIEPRTLRRAPIFDGSSPINFESKTRRSLDR
jgi:hypothetical protein